MIEETIGKAGLIPVIALKQAEQAAPLCEALARGGLPCAEITFRTEAGREAIRIVAREYPDFLLGAGTVTRIEEVEAAKEAGAQFAVAPGLNPRIVKRAQELGLPFFPGVCTPSEVEQALELGCGTLKYFPAESIGGLPLLKALYGPYKHRGLRFVPTGGIGPKNVAEYTAHPAVLAVGGSWIVSPELIDGGQWERISELTRNALRLIEEARSAA